jgi:TfoX/Sxy family transcriptional regulator of competence genes
MPYDETLATRIRKALATREGITEKRMFGGIAFMLKGNMCCGVVKNDLMVRVGPDHYENTLAEPHTRPMDFTGRPMTGFVFVDRKGHEKEDDLLRWVKRAIEFAESLPPNNERKSSGSVELTRSAGRAMPSPIMDLRLG